MKPIKLNNIENIKFFESLIDQGASAGTLKKRYGLREQSHALIAGKRIEFDSKVTCLECGRKFLYLTTRHLQYCCDLTIDKYLLKYPEAKTVSAQYIIEKSSMNIDRKLSQETKQKIRERKLGKKHSAETIAKLSFFVFWRKESFYSP